MKHTPVPQNFIYPDIPETTYVFGSGQFSGEVLRSDGDWRDYLPPEELQRRNGIESSSCYIQAQQHTLATILEEKYGVIDENFSERFNALLSSGTVNGGSPLLGAQSMRDDGLIPDSLLSFDNINSWEEFHSFKGQSESLCRLRGNEWRTEWDPRYEIVFKKEDPVSKKYAKIAERLKTSPMPVSVTAWYEKDGIYIKPEGESDNHFVELVYVSPTGEPYIWDTYEPFIKKLDKWYNFDLGMSWTISRIENNISLNKSFLERIRDIIKSIFKY